MKLRQWEISPVFPSNRTEDGSSTEKPVEDKAGIVGRDGIKS
jgi:hypothetical protein